MLRKLFKFDLTSYIPIRFQNIDLGWIHRTNLEKINLKTENNDFIAYEKVLKASRKEDLKNFQGEKLSTEYCPVFKFCSLSPKTKFNHNLDFGLKCLFNINREFLQFFGFPAYGVHCNVWTNFGNSIIMHLAIRSKKIKKFPNLVDNLIAGGQPSGISIKNNLFKEAYEEAGLKKKIIRNAKMKNTVSYHHNEKTTFNSSVIFIYDLKVEKNIAFKNIDGEVDSFISEEINCLYSILEKETLKPNCIIPIADFFLRKLGDYFPRNGILEIKKLLGYSE